MYTEHVGQGPSSTDRQMPGDCESRDPVPVIVPSRRFGACLENKNKCYATAMEHGALVSIEKKKRHAQGFDATLDASTEMCHTTARCSCSKKVCKASDITRFARAMMKN